MRKRYLHSDGHILGGPVGLAGARRPGQAAHFVSHVADLTEEIKAAERIEQINRS